ncbi:MAG: phosphoserine transaminase [Pseudomonadota bacterium]
MSMKPVLRPADPRFSSGPTRKRPGWEPSALSGAPVGRSHRSTTGKARIAEALERTSALLEIPHDYRVVLLPGSDTGAIEAAMWCLLGAKPVDLFAFDEFGRRWLTDARDQLRLENLSLYEADYGHAPDFSAARDDHDIVFTWNATAAGVRVPDADWIAADRTGLTLCDATSAAFAMPLAWDRLDVTTFSWQKCLGGEAQHGMAVLSPRARARLADYRPPWPVPRVMNLFGAAADDSAMFDGDVLNTPSLLAIEDYLDALRWAAREGGLAGLIARTEANVSALTRWVEARDWIDFLCPDPAVRSTTSVTLKFSSPQTAELSPAEARALAARMARLLAREDAAFDITGHKKARPGLRIWCGPTVETDDIVALGPWLDWAYEEALAAG